MKQYLHESINYFQMDWGLNEPFTAYQFENGLMKVGWGYPTASGSNSGVAKSQTTLCLKLWEDESMASTETSECC